MQSGRASPREEVAAMAKMAVLPNHAGQRKPNLGLPFSHGPSLRHELKPGPARLKSDLSPPLVISDLLESDGPIRHRTWNRT